MNSLTGARRLSSVTFHVAETAQSVPRGRPMGARFYQTRPSFGSAGMARPEKMVDDFLRKQDLKAIADSLKLNYQKVSANKVAWLDAVKQVNDLSTESPLSDMSGEEALALLLTLLKAGRACGANLDSAEFAVLTLNLHALGQLSLPQDDRGKLGQFARATEEALRCRLPSRGMGFIDMSAETREESMNKFAMDVLQSAFELGIGPRQEDMGALRGITFDWGIELGAGGFGVDLHSSQPSLLLSRELLSDDLINTLTAHAKNTGQALAQIADKLLVQHAATIAHEIIHAGQYSALSGQPADDKQFLRLQANKFSLAVEELVMGSKPQYQNPECQFVFYPHEMPSWYATFMVYAAICEPLRMEPGLQGAARELVSEPGNSRKADELMNIEPRAVAKLETNEDGVTLKSQARVDKPRKHLDETAARLVTELGKVAPAQ